MTSIENEVPSGPPISLTWRHAVPLAALFVCLAEMGWATAFRSGVVPAVWFPAGLYAASFTLTATSRWPILLVATLVGSLVSNVGLHGFSPVMSVVCWASNSLGTMLGTVLFRREFPPGYRIDNLRTLIWFSTLLGMVAPATAAVTGALGTRHLAESYGAAWYGYSMSGMLGVLVLGPLLVNLVTVRPWREPNFPARALETGLLVLGTALTSECVFGWQQRPIVYAVLPLLACAAIRLELCGAAITSLTLSLFVAWNTSRGLGPFAISFGFREQVLLTQCFLVISILVSLALAVLTMERRQAVVEAAQAAQKLAEAQHALEIANSYLRTKATTDALTQVHNRGAFETKLIEEIARTRRYGTPLSLLLLDVDRFKQFNDQFGHPAGDSTLKRVAKILSRTARATDFVARYGGEEFAIILSHTDLPSALEAGERFRAAIEREAWPRRPITISIGVATLLDGDDDGAKMIAGADAALYASKQAGRNRVLALG